MGVYIIPRSDDILKHMLETLCVQLYVLEPLMVGYLNKYLNSKSIYNYKDIMIEVYVHVLNDLFGKFRF